MAQGRVIAEGPPHSIMQNEAVIDAYLGSHHDAPLSVEEEQKQLESAEEALAEEIAATEAEGPAKEGWIA
jgi:branched-chain amino acid transport system ATP-binding protein